VRQLCSPTVSLLFFYLLIHKVIHLMNTICILVSNL
jgi:hypothetical protein